MHRSFLRLGLALAAAAAVHGFTANAAADNTVVGERATITTPNRSLLHSGVVTLSLAYIPAFVVAVESPVVEDRQLFIPVAGPWIDFATRDCTTCEHERLNKALLVTDGVFQGIGALNILGAFLFPETRVVATSAHAPNFAVAPSRLRGGGYGIAAVGQF